jgi:hypothetical protein
MKPPTFVFFCGAVDLYVTLGTVSCREDSTFGSLKVSPEVKEHFKSRNMKWGIHCMCKALNGWQIVKARRH